MCEDVANDYLQRPASDYTASCRDRQTAGRAYERQTSQGTAYSVTIVSTGPTGDAYNNWFRSQYAETTCIGPVVGRRGVNVVNGSEIAVRKRGDLTSGAREKNGNLSGRCFKRRLWAC